MTYAFTQELPFTRDVYERFCAALPDESPQGLIARVVSESETGLRLFDVWQSEDDYERYLRSAVQPIVSDGFFNGTGYEPPEREPSRQALEVVDVWIGAAGAHQQVLRDDPDPKGTSANPPSA